MLLHASAPPAFPSASEPLVTERDEPFMCSTVTDPVGVRQTANDAVAAQHSGRPAPQRHRLGGSGQVDRVRVAYSSSN